MEIAPVYFKEMREAIGAGDKDQMYKAAHRVKGLAANVGGEALGGMASEIEALARQEAFDPAGVDTVLLKNELDRLGQALRETDWTSLCRCQEVRSLSENGNGKT